MDRKTCTGEGGERQPGGEEKTAAVAVTSLGLRPWIQPAFEPENLPRAKKQSYQTNAWAWLTENVFPHPHTSLQEFTDAMVYRVALVGIHESKNDLQRSTWLQLPFPICILEGSRARRWTELQENLYSPITSPNITLPPPNTTSRADTTPLHAPELKENAA